jgi:hypothetical protein
MLRQIICKLIRSRTPQYQLDLLLSGEVNNTVQEEVSCYLSLLGEQAATRRFYIESEAVLLPRNSTHVLPDRIEGSESQSSASKHCSGQFI